MGGDVVVELSGKNRRTMCDKKIPSQPSSPDSDSPMTVTGASEVPSDRLVNIIAARLNFSPLTAPLFALYQVNWVPLFEGMSNAPYYQIPTELL